MSAIQQLLADYAKARAEYDRLDHAWRQLLDESREALLRVSFLEKRLVKLGAAAFTPPLEAP